VGYNETSNSYKVYIPDLRKKIIHNDVKFEEEMSPRKSCSIDSSIVEV